MLEQYALFITKFKYISQIVLVFPFLTLNKWMSVRCSVWFIFVKRAEVLMKCMNLEFEIRIECIETILNATTQKVKFSIKGFFIFCAACDQYPYVLQGKAHRQPS